MSQDPRKPHIGDATRPDPDRGGLSASDWIALLLSALWFFAVGLFFLLLPLPAQASFDPARFVMMLLAVFMPVALIWVGATAAKSARMMREESNRLQAAIDAMRHAYTSQAPQGASGTRLPLEQKLDEIARAQKKTEAALAHLTSVNSRAAAVAVNEGKRAPVAAPKRQAQRSDEVVQPTLALGTPADALADPISSEDFIRAMNFPEDERDKEGFRALRAALKDRGVAPLVRSAQDILTLLAEDGIYMDDLAPDRAKPEVWRRFAEGERGRAVASLGGVRDRSSLALTAGRMRQDPVFRDCAHHFLRKFDSTFANFEKTASDPDIAAFAETRSARAFMLIGRVSGTFD
ncbi:hypothetical protein [Tropicimonas sp. IMCC6043]|uniref:hypothetical protein n=1 Tax=Tropicimonas sp. IMCC6043 TaxID=2510645 RepID=UPI00101C18B7|nr:hypothetical protein [Tropicimonas sp. IMCC6043]RYH06492.1 hypothetical protein EU800_23660 [Tropicimonas sp. IMCC6043]